MRKNISILSLIFVFFVSSLPASLVFAGTQAVDYLCELGVTFYKLGKYEDALSEFNKVLAADPGNTVARKYIEEIFKTERTQPMPEPKAIEEKTPLVTQKEAPVKTAKEVAPVAPAPAPKPAPEQPQLSREEMINNTFAQVWMKSLPPKKEAPAEEGGLKIGGIKISGEVQLRGGFTHHDAYWKRANWDLNEKNWRMLSEKALDARENTYDPRIYDRLRLDLNTENEEGFDFHSNIMIDPWSFTGKSEKITLTAPGGGGDPAEIELKYWSNTGYTVNETVDTLKNGDSFNLPEIKVDDGRISIPVKVVSAFGNTYTIPQVKIQRNFQPVRELWLDYKKDDLKLRIYPIGYENQALSFDDPLRLSNNRIWWEESPWIRRWKHGHFNSGASPVDFTRGYWDNSLSFFARDSEARRLTALRGFSFEYMPAEGTTLQTSVATPKDPWQEYSEVDNFVSATRLKHAFTDSIDVGVTATTRFGYNIDNHNKLDARNYVTAADVGYEITNGIKTTFEVARSQSKYDITDPTYTSEFNGWAYNFSILGRFPLESIMNTEYGYFGIQPQEHEPFFTKFRLFANRMDDSFDEPLSSYRETRDDEWWGRHIHFREPLKYNFQGEGELLSWDDIKNFKIGNGIDIGRDVFGLRVESLLWDKKVDNLFDVRNVHARDGKFIENVFREELTWNITDRLTSKVLGLYNRLPKTHKGIDPFVFNPRTGRFFINDYIEDGKDPSIATGSMGLEYKFYEWLALNGIWEYTNDISLAYDNFPRGILNDGNQAYIFYDEARKYRDRLNWLYGQEHFARPPYPYYNIFKAGLRFNPIENMEIYLDYTRNPFEKAGQVDDNMNHIGFQLGYTPFRKLSFFLKYSYSRWQDLNRLVQNINKVYGHHNAFAEIIYRKSEDEYLTLQFGEASRNPYEGDVLDITWDPYGGSLRTIDTQQIYRLYYRRKF